MSERVDVTAYHSAYPGSMFPIEGGGYVGRGDAKSLAGALLELVAEAQSRAEEAEHAMAERDAAIAELVEADRELDSAWDAHGDLSRDELDSQDAIDAAEARIDLAVSRRAAALARFGGAS